MKMKVHQTLVWLNLLSLGTKGLTEPTIGIQSGLCHGRGLARTASQQHSLTTLIRHFVCIKPAYTVPPSCLSQQYCVSQVRELKTCRPRRYGKVVLVVLLRTENTCRPGRYGRESRQCCQVAEIPAKKLKRGHRKKKFVAEFWLILPKTGRKGAAENFQNKFLIFSCDNHV